jgi:hypothetical protein
MLLDVPVSTMHIQGLLQAIQVHHLQPLSLLFGERPCLTESSGVTKQQNWQPT